MSGYRKGRVYRFPHNAARLAPRQIAEGAQFVSGEGDDGYDSAPNDGQAGVVFPGRQAVDLTFQPTPEDPHNFG